MTEQLELPADNVPDEFSEFVFTNDKTNTFPQNILHLFYTLVQEKYVGIMHAKHEPSGDIHTVLVGLEYDEAGGVSLMPMAKILSQQEQEEYLAPDGNGGYIGDNSTDAS